MKIAVTHENGNIFQHFGHCEEFKIYTVENNIVTDVQIIYPIEGGHGALSGFLKRHEVSALICGGIGAGARTALAEEGIKLFPGAEGDCDEAVIALLYGHLKYDPDTQCNHHHHDHDHDHGHSCGGCGQNKHGCGGNH